MAIKPRVKFSNNAFTAENATSSAADAQQESVWEKKYSSFNMIKIF